MALTPKPDVRALAALTRIAIAEDAIPTLEKELGGILSFVEQVQDFDSTGGEGAVGLHNVMRPDTDAEESGIYTEALLKAAPKRTGDYFEVKQVLAHNKGHQKHDA